MNSLKYEPSCFRRGSFPYLAATYRRQEKAYTPLLHSHREWLEITYVSSGSGEQIIGERNWHVSEGDLMICNCGVVHGENPLSVSNFKTYCFNFTNVRLNGVPENCLIDMKGVLSDRSEYAMEGIFYLDCGSSTAAVYAALSGAGTAKYPAAQFTVLEESTRGNLRKRLGESPDAVYYLLTMALLAMLNLLNFGNVAGYWVSERRKEIYARRLCGGARRSVATKLTLEFSLTAGILIAAGTAIGALFAAQAVRISGKAIILGFGIDALQWAIFVLFGAVLLRKECRSTIPELARPLH